MVCKQLAACIADTYTSCKRERECIEYTDSRSTVRCEEHRKKYLLKNDMQKVRIRKYRLDHGIVKDEKGFDACDNLLAVYDGENPKLIFVELKGNDLKHAIEQVYLNIQHFVPELKKNRFYARIVHTQGIPRIGNSGKQVDLEGAVRSRGGNLKMKEWTLSESLSELDNK